MKRFIKGSALSVAVGAAIAGSAQAQTNVPAGLHNVSENWTLAGSPYRLQGQVYFTAGTTLTIDAGVIVASLPADQGSLAICRGAKIFVNGTQDKPVIMTSTNDVATWTGTVGVGPAQIPGNPLTGTWREAANEWGNLTIMGNAYISENAPALGNSPIPSASNVADMEGLTNGPATDRYGGGNDDDDSGSISYLSLRYGGKVIGLANELNGMSLGGIGRDTDIHHIDIMNNIDDGIEVWGGTVNLKNINVWNIGDDSLDIDQGWRGKAQFGLLVQGYSIQAAQGGGTGDNLFETDGAEDSFWQPVTTTTIYNFTVIGMPNAVDPVNNSNGGDHGTAWRANARVQYRNSIFMDLGERLVSFDNSDGDTPLADSGYGASGSLSWAATWTTPFNAVPPYPFSDPAIPANFYKSQSAGGSGFGGRLAEITDCVMFRNQHVSAYTEANLRDVFNPLNNNVNIGSILDAASPITTLTRAPAISYLGLSAQRVATLDPRPKNQALTSVAAAPVNDNFFQPANYRGAFAPGAQSWICGWTAASAFGFVSGCGPGLSFCFGDGKFVACPCAAPNTVPNPPSQPERGCANSFDLGGALLTATGTTVPDTVAFNINVGPFYAAFAFLIKGNASNVTGLAINDGVLCASGTLVRFGSHNAGTNGAPLGSWTYPNTAQTTSVSAATLQAPSQSAYYQLFYRNSTANFCTSATSNYSNAYQIRWP